MYSIANECVVAFLPDNRPASANNSAPEHTDATMPPDL